MTSSRWDRPEVYPLVAATGVAIGLCAFLLVRDITGNPEVSHWVWPEVYPLFAVTGVAIGICAFLLVRNITGNPEVRCTHCSGTVRGDGRVYRHLRVPARPQHPGNPEVRVSKVGRAAGVLDNHEEGRRYAEHGLRSFVRDKTPEIMPGLTKFFTEPK